jgi:hypothetical protein
MPACAGDLADRLLALQSILALRLYRPSGQESHSCVLRFMTSKWELERCLDHLWRQGFSPPSTTPLERPWTSPSTSVSSCPLSTETNLLGIFLSCRRCPPSLRRVVANARPFAKKKKKKNLPPLLLSSLAGASCQEQVELSAPQTSKLNNLQWQKNQSGAAAVDPNPARRSIAVYSRREPTSKLEYGKPEEGG